jgi:hypothetical protein
MDDIVKAALKKWPNVPHCRGWLALDARGDWYMRDDRTQAAGPFPQVKGSRILHEKLREFIQRNYASDESGSWFFQNGPQRVYVELEAAPWVWRVQQEDDAIVVRSHTGHHAAVDGAYEDEAGRLFPHPTSASASCTPADMEVAARSGGVGRLAAGADPLRCVAAQVRVSLEPGAAADA